MGFTYLIPSLVEGAKVYIGDTEKRRKKKENGHIWELCFESLSFYFCLISIGQELLQEDSIISSSIIRNNKIEAALLI